LTFAFVGVAGVTIQHGGDGMDAHALLLESAAHRNGDGAPTVATLHYIIISDVYDRRHSTADEMARQPLHHHGGTIRL
jgi:hypothetical protein